MGEIRETEKHYSSADAINRRARAAVVILLLGTGAYLFAFGSDQPAPPASEVLGSRLIAAGGNGLNGVLVIGGDRQTTPVGSPRTTTTSTLAPATDPVVELRAGKAPTTSTSVVPDQTTTTSTVPPTTTSTVPPTTTTTTTTTTTVPPTTTTTVPPTTTTTTVPPTTTTTTTVPPTGDAWFAILDASLSCVGHDPVITWFVYDPSEPWSDGWQLVIDGASRGLFAPGTIVTANGGPGVAVETVAAGSHTLVVDRHWETFGGRNPRGYGSNSLTVVVEKGACA